jgi:hypothetical protein
MSRSKRGRQSKRQVSTKTAPHRKPLAVVEPTPVSLAIPTGFVRKRFGKIDAAKVFMWESREQRKCLKLLCLFTVRLEEREGSGTV